VIRFRFVISPIKVNPTGLPLEHLSQAWSNPVKKNKREESTNSLIRHLSSRVSWPNLITIPLMGDAAVGTLTPD
jgi:hypothetical protein